MSSQRARPGSRSAPQGPALGEVPSGDDTYVLGSYARMPADPKRVLESCPNLFQLLGLVEERGSSGIVEKIVIRRESFGRLLNLLQPESYKSISRIDLKSLDKLSIKPVGIYGDPSEIIMLLQRVGYLDSNSAVMSLQVIKSGGPTSLLSSGLYLALDPKHIGQNSKSAYIFYWPEETTWNNQLVTSVRNNRTMFMRYLTRLVDQIIAAVSAEQAQNFNWEAHAGEFNQEADKQSTDGLSLFDAQNLDQIPDKFHPSAGPGFTIPVKPEYFPNGIENTEARLVPGEDNTALLVVSRNIEERKFEDTLSAEELRKMIDDCSLQLGQVSAEDVAVLAAHGLREKYSDAFETYDQRLKLLQSDRIALGMFEERRVEDILKQDKGAIIAEVHGIIKTIDSKTYPSLSWGENPPKSEITVQMRQKYPLLDEISKNLGHAYRPDLVKDEEFQTLKSRCLFVQAYFSRNPRLSVAQRIGCVDYIFNRIPYSVPGPPTAVAGPGESDGRARPSSVHWIIGTDPFSSLAPGEGNRHPTPKDPDFIGGIALLESAHPELSGIAQRIQLCLRRFLTNLKEDITADEVARILKSEWERLTREARNEQEHQFQAGQQQALDALLRYLRQAMYLASTITKHRRRLDSITELPREPYSDGTARFHCVGWLSFPGSAWDNYSIYPLELSQPEQADQIQLCKTKLKFDFNLEHGQSIEFMQLVNDKCLVVISGQQWIQIHVGDGARLKRTIRNAQPKVKLNCDAPGQQYMFAFDQVTRLMAMIHGHKDGRKLSIYSFDERFANVRSRGSPMLLKNWYSEPTELHGICFVSGLEEICLIETSGRFRIISLVTQQFRTASLRVSPPIIDAFSAPGGPYLLLALGGGEKSNQHQLVAFHRTTFETHEGAINSFALFSCSGPRVATSFKREGFVHVVSFSMATKAITSTILQITPKTSKPLLHSERKHSRGIRVETVNNCLIDCHSEVWTQFPVVSVVTRNTPTAIDRQPRQLIFVSPTTIDGVGGYFARMISTFQTATQKPIGESSSATKVRSINSAEISEYISNQISEFKTGSFIVEFLCLIPLHLAVARENRFIPLKDGVWNPDYERSLLGEDVPAMIDVLSLGWYESIFQSYMAKKTVRVVSSMGEPSTGNSYFLNHFADTSFIGSAMCDNEGVWLTCTPVDKYLLVLLNFEGNYSTESGGQKDAPLVLFNTAISNLVLFQSDFAVSRDATGLFTIFQSPTTVLDPNVNRGLFNSTLTIVIKDVPNADSKDIVREFSLKFQAIVDQERGQNFVTRLHRGRIQIVPWPVVNSPAFYNLYDRLHQRLDQEPFTHGSGGAFLRSLKALMAMVNTTDGGSLDQHLAAHRAQQIMERLPSALCYGRDAEGLLKNMDADEDLQSPNHKHSFFVPEFAGENATENKALVERALQSLVQMCHPTLQTRYQIPDASYIEALQNRLYEMLDERLSLVRRWMSVNMERFPSGNQKMRNLTGKLSSAELSMRNAVKLCSYECSDCFLLCLRPSQHSGDHGCGTDHGCVSSCEITEEHLQREGCGLPAGHKGRHVCDEEHSCGLRCDLNERVGCAQSCIKPLDHEGEHLCAARVHLCGEPCELRNVSQGDNRGLYNCPGTCGAPWDEPHKHHICENARGCPIECKLCRQLCCSTDHFHGLDPNAIHLCGQEHYCFRLCESDGVCLIETRPAALEPFSGRYESFMYTRYTQVERRLSCVIPIPPGELTHDGPHTHSTNDYAFHFCDVRCPNCEYLCTLPLGHGQQLHETSHGSMITTQWVLQREGNSDDEAPVYELQARKFGPGDDGAPMLCNTVCTAQGRHVHIDFCRDPENCSSTDCEHIKERMHPDPDRPKDWISHATFWARTGFKDPYSQEEQNEFSKCDALCAGPEHEATSTFPANPSYCTLPIFHPPKPQQPAPVIGYVSGDGHAFDCSDPSQFQQAYHIVFVVDSSASMTSTDRRPLTDTPISARLISSCNNRYGAVLSALYGFWLSRHMVATASTRRARRDAYSVITFGDSPTTRLQNDFLSTPDQLIGKLIPQMGKGSANLQAALTMARSLIVTHWSGTRSPVIIFLADGKCRIPDQPVYDLCHACIRLGEPLALYSVSFGTDTYSTTLRRMAEIAHEVFDLAPQDALTAIRGNPCAYTNAIDSIQLVDTFVGINNAPHKPRASLMSRYGSGGRRTVYGSTW